MFPSIFFHNINFLQNQATDIRLDCLLIPQVNSFHLSNQMWLIRIHEGKPQIFWSLSGDITFVPHVILFEKIETSNSAAKNINFFAIETEVHKLLMIMK